MFKKIVFLLTFTLTMSLTACNKGNVVEAQAENTITDVSVKHLSGENSDYQLKQVVVLSRHNVRSPLSNRGSVLDSITPHKWFDWTSDVSHLSIRGGVLETEMGQYFRKWLEREKLFGENYDPKNVNVATDEVRIYANSKQRTLATANYFLTGLFPISDLDIEHHMPYDEMDPTFNPVLTDINETFAEKALKEINDLFTNAINDLKPNYELIGNVIDIKESNAYKDGSFTGFKTDDSIFTFENGKEPKVEGSLKLACQISDALTVQYYEDNDKNAAFGKNISYKDWEAISKIKDVYEDVLFTAPIVAYNVANPLLREMLSELKNNNRKFTFLCGHDSNLDSVLAALSVKEYFLPQAIERKTPIGGKIVVSTWGKDDNPDDEYISIELMYQSVDQLRGIKMLDEKNPPMIFPLNFNGIERNEDGYFKKSDVIKIFEEAIAKK